MKILIFYASYGGGHLSASNRNKRSNRKKLSESRNRSNRLHGIPKQGNKLYNSRLIRRIRKKNAKNVGLGVQKI